LLYKLLAYDPLKRITADEALKHEYFRELYQMEMAGGLNSTFTSIKHSPSS
jgi:serine/threonine protein kinase